MFNFVANMLMMAHRRQPGDPLVDPPSWRPRWMSWLSGVWIVNFAAFMLAAAYLGGDALNGYVKDGHYFLRAHAQEVGVEVSRSVYLYSEWHAFSVILSLAVVVLMTVLIRGTRA